MPIFTKKNWDRPLLAFIRLTERHYPNLIRKSREISMGGGDKIHVCVSEGDIMIAEYSVRNLSDSKHLSVRGIINGISFQFERKSKKTLPNECTFDER